MIPTCKTETHIVLSETMMAVATGDLETSSLCWDGFWDAKTYGPSIPLK